mmetsp:Transcript_108818/g.336112  ORF Transcript_108818/g.336112 Transcript_108818/m.336112 type:complete len:260 (-) Transcript_108818:149-928(-)
MGCCNAAQVVGGAGGSTPAKKSAKDRDNPGVEFAGGPAADGPGGRAVHESSGSGSSASAARERQPAPVAPPAASSLHDDADSSVSPASGHAAQAAAPLLQRGPPPGCTGGREAGGSSGGEALRAPLPRQPPPGGGPPLGSDDPPLLGADGGLARASSARALAARRLLERSAGGVGTAGATLDLRLPRELAGVGPRPHQPSRAQLRPIEQSARHADGGAPASEGWPDTELLSTVEDRRVMLADLDGDMQLPSLGGRKDGR